MTTFLFVVTAYCVFASICAFLKYSADKSPKLWEYSPEPLLDYFKHALPFTMSYVFFMMVRKFFWQGLAALFCWLAFCGAFVYLLPPNKFFIDEEGIWPAYLITAILILTVTLLWGSMAPMFFSKKTIGIEDPIKDS